MSYHIQFPKNVETEIYQGDPIDLADDIAELAYEFFDHYEQTTSDAAMFAEVVRKAIYDKLIKMGA